MSKAVGGKTMTAKVLLTFLLLGVSQGEAGERWSRQLTSEAGEDWVPLETSALNKRQATARVLTHPAPFQSSFFPAETFPSDFLPQESPRQLYLQSVPSGQQYQSSHQPLQLALTNQYNPLAQGFLPPSGLQYNNIQQNAQASQYQPQTVNTQYVQHPAHINNQFYNVNQGSPVQNQAQNQEAPRFVDGYKLENSSTDFFQGSAKKKPIIPIVKSKQEPVLKPQQATTKKATDRSSTSKPTTPTLTTVEKEEVQLLYVPLETLQSEQFNVNKYLNGPPKQEVLRDSLSSPGQINNQLYSPTTPSYFQRQQTQLHHIQQDLVQQAFNAQNLQGKFKQNNQFDRQSNYHQSTVPIALPFSQPSYPAPVITTPKSKKLKAHQPPLAVFMVYNGPDKAKLSDVLGVLKNAKSVSVLDSVGPNSPKVFIGPSTLRAPEQYTKFELPYLSSVDGNRIQRKVDQLPFFVAPLSYKAPEGFAKIPFPAPHVGSVIVNPFMMEPQELRPTPHSLLSPSSFAYSTFQNNPSTDAFRPTVSEPPPPKQSTFSFFPSATPNPIISSQSTASDFQSSFLPFDTSSLGPFRPQPTVRKPEPTIISSSRQPLASYFTTTPSKPTVSYFSFPEYSTLPTTNKPKNVFSYDNRGHYITNAAVDTSSPPLKTNAPARETSTTKLQTTPLPSSSPKYENHNPYSINQAFALRNPYEPINFQTNIRANEIRQYKPEPLVQTVNQNSYNSFSQPPPPPPPKYSEVSNNQRPSNFQYSTINEYTPRPYFTQTSPTVAEPPQPSTEKSPLKSIEYDSKDYSQSFNEYSSPSAEAEYEDTKKITPDEPYQTESPTTRLVTAPSTTTTSTTTTTTTAAPATRATRRPIHSRGRPRYTTPKPDNSETTTRAPVTRRTPIRERKPNNFRAKLENNKASTTTESSADMTNFEPAKKRGESKDAAKSSTRHPSHRYKAQEEEVKEEKSTTTTESSLKATIASRNQRLRTRGRTHYKNQDNQESSDALPKKSKKQEGDSLAYQRDVLHQNYPVTLTERMSTLEVYTSTPMPSSVDLSNGKIRIYETTGSSSPRPHAQEVKQPESSLDFYDNQPIFQGEQEKFLTQPDAFIEINSANGRNTASSPAEEYSVSQESTTAASISSTSQKFEEVSPSQVTSQEYYPVDNDNFNENYELSLISKEQAPEIIKQEVEVSTKQPIEYTSEPAVTSETPVPKFRSKLRARPKLLPTLSVVKQNEEEVQQIDNDSFLTKQMEESIANNFGFTRRSSLQPVTYRPAFDRRRTTMRIEEIEAELKSSRQQVKSALRPTTYKSPVYIPESTSATPNVEINLNEENDVTSTTKRNHFIRRRPVRPTTAFVSSTTARPKASNEQLSVNENGNRKVVRMRGRLRTRPTSTEKVEVVEQIVEEQSPSSVNSQEVDDKYLSATQRASLQKYTTRGRQATQKYFKRPAAVTERNSQSSAESVEDQASYDSINRPEYIQFKPDIVKADFDYNPDNGKSETQWSPKLSYNSFKPIFNPNLIADDIKQDGIEYGTKLPSEINTEKTDIITAGNPYDDVLISVTPASNNLNMDPSTVLKTETPLTPEVDMIKINDKYEKIPETASSFESVLEEVMRSLEQQDENEYTEYSTVMKHKGGEIGEIPPESDVEPDFGEIVKDSKVSRYESEKNIPTRDYYPKQTERPEVAQKRAFSMIPEIKFQTSTTERQPRRRGVWRKIKVRPAHKDVFDTAESQFYGNSNNDIKNDDKPKAIPEQVKPTPEVKKVIEEVIPEIKQSPVQAEKEEKVQPTISTTIVPEEDLVTENMSPGDMDLGTGSPDNMNMEVVNLEPTVLPIEDEKEDTTEENKTEFFNPTTLPLFESEDGQQEVIEDEEDIKTTMMPILEKETETNKTNLPDIKIIETSFVTEISKDERVTTTTEIPLGVSIDTPTDVTSETNANDKKEQTITNVLEKILSELEDPKESDKSKDSNKSDIDLETSDFSHKVVKKTESIENAPPINFFDPKSIISTSVSTEVSHETEICYRGRCIKTKKQDHKKVKSGA